MESLPFDDDHFDTIIAANALQYAANRDAALQEFKRVCAAQARVVVGLFGSPDGVAYRAVFSAIRDALPEPPSGGGPFELSMPGVLESLVEQAGFAITDSQTVDCPFVFPDMETYLRAAMSGGPIQNARRILGDEKVSAVLRDTVSTFRTDDGAYVIAPNFFKYVVASVPQ